MNGWVRGLIVGCLVVAAFLAMTMSVQAWLAAERSSGDAGVVMTHPTPDPHP
jgi:hypothetical protein